MCIRWEIFVFFSSKKKKKKKKKNQDGPNQEVAQGRVPSPILARPILKKVKFQKHEIN